MGYSKSTYSAHTPDKDGHIQWSESENSIWATLMARQKISLKGKASQPFLDGLSLLALPEKQVPQLADINRVLRDTTGWQTAPVPALIDFGTFFNLLADKKFPVATFIRRIEDLDYLQEPDIFHEIFGHCPLLTNPAFAEFTHLYGKLGQHASHQQRLFLARLYWFTVEFGLVENKGKRAIYGGGILSSPGETDYAFNSETPERKPFDLIEVLRTPYRIDVLQPVYFYLDSIEQLFDIAKMDIGAAITEAMTLGLLPAPHFAHKSV